MNSYYQRILLFLFGCITVRLLLVFIAKYTDTQYLPYLGIIALLPALGFITIYLFDLRKTGTEVFGDKIWWNDLRPVHACLYLLFALLAFKKNPLSWIVLLSDVLIGLVAFIYYDQFQYQSI